MRSTTRTSRPRSLGRPLVAVLLAGMALAGCKNGGEPLAPDLSAHRGAALQGATPRELTVLTWNMFVGTDLDAALAALGDGNPANDLAAIEAALQTLHETDVSARADAFADEVARFRPAVLGFNEVSRIYVDGALTGGTPIDLDFLAILRQALAARGLKYDLAATGPGVQVSLAGGAVRLSDHDVLLTRHGTVRVLSGAGHAFSANLGEVVPGVQLIRGWAQARLRVHGDSYTVVSTHPESDQGTTSLDGLRQLQMGELVSVLPVDEPVLLTGDLNGTPDTDMYSVLTGAGYTDVWHALRPRASGFTCCNSPDLSNPVASYDHRIDYIFEKGFAPLRGLILRIGDRPDERVAGPDHPIWPSDHAGLVSTLGTRTGPPR